MKRSPREPLRLLSYLAPSIPGGLFELLAQAIAEATGRDVTVDFETTVSGPVPGTDPFASGRADVAFVCGPSYALLRSAGAPVEVVPAAAVFDDPRNQGHPVYFSDVVVRRDHPARTLADLRGAVWTYNDRQSLSGWHRMLAALEGLGLGAPEQFFSRLLASGAHVRSIELVSCQEADVSAVDSNVLLLERRRDPGLDRRFACWNRGALRRSNPFSSGPDSIRCSRPRSPTPFWSSMATRRRRPGWPPSASCASRA